MALICNPPPLRSQMGKYGDCKHERLQARETENNQTRKKYQRRSGIVVCVTDVCGFFQLAFLMTADLDAQPRLTKHFDSPFVVRLRLCFSPFFFIIVFLLFKSLRKIPGVCYLSPPIIIIRVAPTRQYGCQYMFFQGKVDSLSSIIAAFTLVLEYACPGILVVLSMIECSAYEDICPSIPDGAIYSF